jgi:hypothetical protein
MDKLIQSILFNQKDDHNLSQQLEEVLQEKDPFKCFPVQINLLKILQSDTAIPKIFIRKPKTILEKIRMSLINRQNEMCLMETYEESQTKPLKFGCFNEIKQKNTNTKIKKMKQKLKQKQIKMNLQIIPKFTEDSNQTIGNLLNSWKVNKENQTMIQRNYREELSILRGRVVRLSQAKMWEKLSLHECPECRQTQVSLNELNALEDSFSTVSCLAQTEISKFNWRLWSRNNNQRGICQAKLTQKREGILGKFVEVHLEIEKSNF